MSSIISIFWTTWYKLLDWWQIILNYEYSVYILIGLLIVLGFFSKVKNKVIATIIGILGVIVTLLLIGIFFTKGWDYMSNYIKKHPSKTTTEQTTPAQQSTQGAPEIYGIEPDVDNGQQPSYEAPKQLFYSVSCNGCYASGCPSNGYYYSGYDAGSYAYYYGLCQSCSCSSVVGHSFWK